MSRVPTYKEIGMRIKSLREKRGFSQEQLANELGLSRPVITKIEGGKKAINSLELRQVADVLGISTDELTRPVDEETLVGRFRTRHNTDDPALIESVEKIDQIFKEIVGQVELWRQSDG
jgi:transcriptional regulator with XRE-family HTH domain